MYKGTDITISTIVEIDKKLWPDQYILGNLKTIRHTVKPLANWVQINIMIGKQIIMRKWKDVVGPLFQDWASELGKEVASEKIYCLMDKMETYYDKWGKSCNFILWRTYGLI